MKKKNTVASVKGRLLNIARTEGKSHQLLLLRYFQERFLYRLSQSSYRNLFCLKGAAFLYALEGEKSRVTKDIDFLGMGFDSDELAVRRMITTICSISYQEDAVTFDVDSLSVGDITKDGNYKGLRIGITAHMEKTRQRLQIDIGFGDAVLPGPIEMIYPVILDMDAPKLFAYSIESTIAEKFEAMIDLAEVNTRLKDFYDVYHLLKNHPINEELLEAAIRETFNRRMTPATNSHSLFSESFREDVVRNQQWKAWKKKVNLGKDITFPEVMVLIQERLLPIYLNLL